MTDLTVSATFTKNGGQPATGLTLSDLKFFLTQQDKATGVDTTVWDGTQVATIEINNVATYTRILATADLTTNSYFGMIQYTGATVLDSNYVYGSVGQVEADVRSMAADVITAAALSSGALTSIVTAIFAGLMEGRAFEEIIKDIWAQVVGDFVANDDDDPTSIVYEGPNGATQLTHTITDTTRTWS